MRTIDEILTSLQDIPFDTLDISSVKRPVSRPVGDVRSATIPSLLVDARLSTETYRREVERVGKIERKRRALRERKVYTRKRGHVHPKKKQASRRRLMARRWRDNPLGVVLYGYGKKAIDKSLWAKYIEPLWDRYNPEDLEIVWERGAGCKHSPKTVYNMNVVHKTEGVVYDGNGQELYDLSGSRASS